MGKLLKQASADLKIILKEASIADPLSVRKAYLGQIVGMFAPVVAAVAAAGGMNYLFAKKDRERHKADLASSFKAIAGKSAAFAKDPEAFIERFGELSVISPTIAKNPGLATKLLEKKLTSGFGVDDIHKLTAIENNASSARGIPLPASAARAGASNALHTLTQTFGMDLLKEYRDTTNVFKKDLVQAKQYEQTLRQAEDLMKRHGFDKKAQAQAVSDECLGQMLADRYVLLKEAGVMDVAAAGAKNLGKSLQYWAPALALGGGVELVRRALESRRNAVLEAQADKNFAHLLRSSDVIKGDKAIATEAFDILKSVAPTLAAKPLVAKTFLEHSVNAMGNIPPATVQQLAEAEDRVRGLRGKNTFFGDLKSIMGLSIKPKEMSEMGFEPARAPVGKPKNRV